jgi:hypothetical protein
MQEIFLAPANEILPLNRISQSTRMRMNLGGNLRILLAGIFEDLRILAGIDKHPK